MLVGVKLPNRKGMSTRSFHLKCNHPLNSANCVTSFPSLYGSLCDVQFWRRNEGMARASDCHFFFFLGSLPPGVAVNKINIHIFYSHTFPPMCCAPGRAANFYPNLLIDDYHRFVSERGLGPFVFASCVCDVTA